MPSARPAEGPGLLAQLGDLGQRPGAVGGQVGDPPIRGLLDPFEAAGQVRGLRRPVRRANVMIDKTRLVHRALDKITLPAE
jgi:hypothetical protein